MKVQLIRALLSIVGRANKNKQNKITSNGYILINIEYVVVNCKHPNGLFVSFKPPDTLRLHERLWMFVYRGCPLAHRKRCSRGAMRHPVVASSSLWWEWCVHTCAWFAILKYGGNLKRDMRANKYALNAFLAVIRWGAALCTNHSWPNCSEQYSVAFANLLPSQSMAMSIPSTNKVEDRRFRECTVRNANDALTTPIFTFAQWIIQVSFERSTAYITDQCWESCRS